MAQRQLTPEEKLIEKDYELKKWKILLNLVAKEIGKDKVIEIARSDDYPKTDEQIIEMLEQGKLIKDLPRHKLPSHKIEFLSTYEDYVKWSDIEKIIK